MIVTILFRELSSLLEYEDFVLSGLVFLALALRFRVVSWIFGHGVILELQFWLFKFHSIQIVSRSNWRTIYPAGIFPYDP